ncbi:MAG: MgtC/SapB family protein [Ignavibacteriaceae bacterium]|nr:MgtC/SapB family protein [Ignavibacteriaceae bacterium]
MPEAFPNIFDGFRNPISYEVLVLLVQKLIVAIFIGLLFGLEREHAKHQSEKIFAGIRTFPLIAILGFLSAFLSEYVISYAFPLLFISFAMLVWISYFHSSAKGHIGITTEIAAMLVFLLSALVYWNFLYTAGIVAVLVAMFLSFKVQLHKFASLVEEKEIYAVLKLAFISVIILPLLPSRTIDPLNILNPRILWLIVIFVAAISFIGYALTKFIGYKKGINYTAVFGGIVSSTALAYTFSKKSKETDVLSLDLGNGIILASLFMYPKVLIILSALDIGLFTLLLPELSLLFAIGLFIVLINRSKTPRTETVTPSLQNPFELKSALIFGAVFTIILFATKFSQIYLGSAGSYLISIFAGVTNIDAITISIAQLKGDEISNIVAANSILFALLANTLSKMAISRIWGTKALSGRTSIGFSILIISTILILSYNLIINS